MSRVHGLWTGRFIGTHCDTHVQSVKFKFASVNFVFDQVRLRQVRLSFTFTIWVIAVWVRVVHKALVWRGIFWCGSLTLEVSCLVCV